MTFAMSFRKVCSAKSFLRFKVCLELFVAAVTALRPVYGRNCSLATLWEATHIFSIV